jgi:hypothetical protein
MLRRWGQSSQRPEREAEQQHRIALHRSGPSLMSAAGCCSAGQAGRRMLRSCRGCRCWTLPERAPGSLLCASARPAAGWPTAAAPAACPEPAWWSWCELAVRLNRASVQALSRASGAWSERRAEAGGVPGLLARGRRASAGCWRTFPVRPHSIAIASRRPRQPPCPPSCRPIARRFAPDGDAVSWVHDMTLISMRRARPQEPPSALTGAAAGAAHGRRGTPRRVASQLGGGGGGRFSHAVIDRASQGG